MGRTGSGYTYYLVREKLGGKEVQFKGVYRTNIFLLQNGSTVIKTNRSALFWNEQNSSFVYRVT